MILNLLLAAAVVGTTVDTSVTVRDANGALRQPLAAPAAGLAVVFFVTHDCPISNYYASEIRRICERDATRGVSCALVYVDPSLTDAAALAHTGDYAHGQYPAVVDRDHLLVREARATITPEVLVIHPDGRIGYRGRIDDAFAELGVSRREVRSRDLRDALDALLSGRPVRTPVTQAIGCFIADLARARRMRE
jgi:hypothetical protein